MKDRIGAPKALTATARKLALIFYQMMSQRESYREAGEAGYTQQQKDRFVKYLRRQAKQCGYGLTPQQA